MKVKRAKSVGVEGVIHACAHRVDWRFWWTAGCGPEITEHVRETLEEDAEERIRHCIAEDYVSGELNSVYVEDGAREFELRGWWEIQS